MPQALLNDARNTGRPGQRRADVWLDYGTGWPGPRCADAPPVRSTPLPAPRRVAESVARVRLRRRRRLSRVFARVILAVGLSAAVVSGVVAYRAGGPYGDRNEQDPRVRRVYDPASGKLTMVAYAADGSLRLDHWCYMDGERLVRMDVDEDGDGAVDRREYYGPGERLEVTEYLDHGRVTRTEMPGSGQGAETGK